MNRVIKFRTWDKIMSNPFKMSEPFNLFFYGGVFTSNAVFMQFTGFKDSKNKEIYEGDIIGDWTTVDGKQVQSRQTVFFDEMLGQWMLDNSFNQDKTFSTSLFSELKDFEYEIIGNRYVMQQKYIQIDSKKSLEKNGYSFETGV